MAGKLGKWQVKGFTSWKGLTNRNHLLAAFGAAPQKASNIMVKLLAYQFGNLTSSTLEQLPVKYFDTDEEYTWDIVGSNQRNIPLVEARNYAGESLTGTKDIVGKNGEPFYLVFPEDWFFRNEVLFGELNELYPIKVMEEAKMEGTNAVYKCYLFGLNEDGIPAKRLQPGERFSHEFSPIEREMSREQGGIRYSTPVEMRNEWSSIRKKLKINNAAMMDQKLMVGVPVIKPLANGGYQEDTVHSWLLYSDYLFEEEFREEKNSVMMFGRLNRDANGMYHDVGDSGFVIKQGSGLREQMESANTMYYNTFSLKLIEDALYQLSASKLGMGDRTFVMKTGEVGALLFHKAVSDLTSGWTQFIMDNSSIGAIKKTNSNLHTNSLSAGFQFTEFKAPNGVTLQVEVSPEYDNPVRNKMLDANGRPLESGRFDILKIGSMDQQNIFKCEIKNRPEVRGYQPGLRDPFTGKQVNYMSTDEDSCTVHKMATFGVCVLDPTRTMSIIPAQLSGVE
jgi:hypothetical protein